MTTERRRRRSNEPREAISLYLESAAARCGAQAAALAAGDGRLLGGAGLAVNLDLERLAALGAGAAEQASEDSAMDALIEDLTRGEDLYASRLTVAGATCYLASVGARLRHQKHVAADLGRMLSNVGRDSAFAGPSVPGIPAGAATKARP